MSIKNDPIEEEWMEQTILNEAKKTFEKSFKIRWNGLSLVFKIKVDLKSH